MKRFLLYVDILGFSNKIKKQSLQENFDYYTGIICRAYIQQIHNWPIRFQVISDTILIWAETDNLNDQLNMLLVIASNLGESSVFEKRYIRGSIVYDDFFIGNKVYHLFNDGISNPKIFNSTFTILGKAIIDANDWEKKQEWAWISVAPDIYETLQGEFNDLLNEAESARYLIKYNVPIKYLSEIETYVINGLRTSRINYLIESLKKEIALLTVGRESEKLQNTLNFFEYIDKNNQGRDDTPAQFYTRLKEIYQ